MLELAIAVVVLEGRVPSRPFGLPVAKWSRWNSTLHGAVPVDGIGVAAIAVVVLEGRVPSRPFGLLFYPPRLMRCMGLWLTTARVPRAPAMPMSRAPARGTSSHRA